MRKKGFKIFLPDFMFSNLTDIKTDFFLGANLIIFDVDNTVVFAETTETKKEVVSWFDEINRAYKCILLSNSATIFKREKQISELLHCKIFLSRHKKPFKSLFLEIKKEYNLGNGKVFIIGDRIFTDILFGNLNKMTTILVKPLSNKENIIARITRKWENFILFLSDLKYN
jgi:HAD superfamily phosphatase (TIGR01668 family)